MEVKITLNERKLKMNHHVQHHEVNTFSTISNIENIVQQNVSWGNNIRLTDTNPIKTNRVVISKKRENHTSQITLNNIENIPQNILSKYQEIFPT